MVRFGGLIAFIGGRDPLPYIWEDLVDNQLVEPCGSDWKLSDKGCFELMRLAAMAGLRPETICDKKQYMEFKDIMLKEYGYRIDE